MARRRKDTRSIGRRSASRAPKRSILIVCEGEKTEPNYVSYFKQELRLANVHLEVCGAECGSDPLSVVEFGEKQFLKERSIDDCLCLIDRDGHNLQRFNAAKAKAVALDAKSRDRDFVVHVSDPCIEYWFILHFRYLRTPFVKQGQKSRAEVAFDKLKEVWPEYEKGSRDIGSHLAGQIDEACKNAERAMKDARDTGEPNPSTAMHLFIERMMKAKS